MPWPWDSRAPLPPLRLVTELPAASAALPSPSVLSDKDLLRLDAAAEVGNDVLEHLAGLLGEDDPVYVSVLHRLRRHAGDLLDGGCRCCPNEGWPRHQQLALPDLP